MSRLPEHQRPEIIREPGKDRQGVKEDHRHAVHREELVVLLRSEQAVVRLRQLQTHPQRLKATDGQKNKRGDDVADADLLVVDGAEPSLETKRVLPLSASLRPASFGITDAGGPGSTATLLPSLPIAAPSKVVLT